MAIIFPRRSSVCRDCHRESRKKGLQEGRVCGADLAGNVTKGSGFAVDFHTTQGVQYREASIGIDCGRSAHGGSNRKRVKLPVGDCGRAGQRTEVNILTKGVGS